MSKSSPDRRTFLRYSSMLPVAVASGAALANGKHAVDCHDVKEHDAVAEDDPIFTEASTALWEEFVNGTRVGSDNPAPIPDALKDHIFQAQGIPLRRKTKFWLVCEQETRMCAYMAGAIAETLRAVSGDEAITQAQYSRAKSLVQSLQRKRMNRANIGIAC